jgi:hypothetical protein
MVKKMTFTILAFLFVSLSVCLAADTVDFSGHWVQDNEKSDLFPRPIMGPGMPPVSADGGGGRGMGGPPMGGMGGPPMGGMGGPPMGGGAKPPVENPPLIITHTGDSIRIHNTAFGRTIIEDYTLDGNKVEEMVPVPKSNEQAKKTTRARIRGNRIQIEEETRLPQGKSEIKKEFSLSKDGKTLTLKIEQSTPMGTMTSRTEQKLVYNRQ